MAEGFTPATPAGMGPITIHRDVSTDLIAWLPQAAADKLRALRQHVEDLHAVVPEFAERAEANAARFEAEQRLKRLQDHPQHGGFALTDDDARVVEAKRNVARLTADAKRLSDRYEARSRTWTAAGQVLRSVEGWLSDGHPAGTLQVFEGREPTLNKGEDIVAAVERLRHRGRELRADLHRLRSTPYPSSHAKQRMREQIAAMAERGRPSVSRLVEHDRDVEFSTADRSLPIIAGSKENPVTTVAMWTEPDVLALFAWMHKDALIAALDREIAAEADDASALTHEARQQQTAEVKADLLAVERDESALVWRAMHERLPVEHRADINPLALLGLSLVTAPRVDRRPGSSPGHSFDLRR